MSDFILWHKIKADLTLNSPSGMASNHACVMLSLQTAYGHVFIWCACKFDFFIKSHVTKKCRLWHFFSIQLEVIDDMLKDHLNCE